MDKCLIASFVLLLSPVWANVIMVNSMQDSGPGTLRSAIDEANMTPGKDTINFTISDTIFLTTAASTNSLLLPQITDTLYIDGNEVTLKAIALGRHLQIAAPCEITDLSFGNGTALLTGGAVRALSSAGIVTFLRCHFIGNHAPGSGGALLTDCPAELKECSFMANTSAEGGSLAMREGILPVWVQLDNCLFIDNMASSQGAAVHLEGGTLQIKSAVFESTEGAFTEDIFIKVGVKTGEVEMLPGFEVAPQPGGLTIQRS